MQGPVTNPPYRHQYSELLITATDSSDCSVTYTVPAYSGSDGTTYSAGAIYHQPNCQCHKMSCQPAVCQSPTNRSDHTDTSGTSTSTETSGHKQAWVTKSEGTPTNRWRKPVAWIWAVVTLLIFLICILCLTQSSWLVNNRTGESLGLLKQTKMDPTSNKLTTQSYKELSTLNLPSVSWRICLIVYSVATALLGLSTLLAFGAVLFTRSRTREGITFCSGYVQLFAVILLTTSILFYMVGLDSPTAKEICKSSSVFYNGECDIGWNYLLLIICSALGILLPVLSHHIDYNVCSPSYGTPRQYIV